MAKSNGGYIIDLCICYVKVKNLKPTNEEEIKKFKGIFIAKNSVNMGKYCKMISLKGQLM